MNQFIRCLVNPTPRDESVDRENILSAWNRAVQSSIDDSSDEVMSEFRSWYKYQGGFPMAFSALFYGQI